MTAERSRTALWVAIVGLLWGAGSLIVLALAGWFAARHGRVFLGAQQADQLYYLACARALFTRGTGLTYPNPYDDRPDAAALYFHLYPLVVGWLARLLSLSLVHAEYLIRLGCAVGLAAGLHRIVAALFPPGDVRRATFWLALCGGGMAWAEGLRRTIAGGAMARFAFHVEASEITGGFWMQNVFRNVFYTSEAGYHALAFWLIGALLMASWRQAAVAFALLLAAHPFTGLQFFTIVGGWIASEWWFWGRRPPRGPLLAMIAAAVAFWGYNVGWLLSFPAHAAIVDHWRTVGFFSGPLPYLWLYAPWLPLVGIAAWRVGGAWLDSPQWRLILTQLVVTAVLMNNHWFLGTERALQPLHFSHGYEFLPLVLLVMSWVGWTATGPARRIPTKTLVPLVLLLSLDNVVFLPRAWRVATQLSLPRAEGIVLDRLAALTPAQEVVSSSALLGFAIPTFTDHRTWIGHNHLTPDVDARLAQLAQWLAGQDGFLAEHPMITLVAVAADEGDDLEGRGELERAQRVVDNEGMRLYQRPSDEQTPRR